MKTQEASGPIAAQELPSAALAVRMGWDRAAAGLSAVQAFYLRTALAFYWQPGGPSLRESCRLATQSHRRIWSFAVQPLSVRQVASRFARLDQVMLLNMRA
jgi:hypothetical protein